MCTNYLEVRKYLGRTLTVYKVALNHTCKIIHPNLELVKLP